MARLAADPQYFARPDRTLFQDIRRYFPITAQAQVAWAVREGVSAAVAFIEAQIEAGLARRRRRRCKATTRKGKACQRTPLPGRDYCPSHQHLEQSTSRAPRPSRRHFRSLTRPKCQSTALGTFRVRNVPAVGCCFTCRTTPTSSSGSSRSSPS